ncbi:hypothetical protein [Cellulomonas sp. KRMCY2]|uniref:hypothetical protein n=1 Tax=Cellulomonas sp. KRMCY2 TaxID=1304865 RepID=UPI00045EAC04|nr:hypothetical protein [Cellulomonas sp. KRMCY2]
MSQTSGGIDSVVHRLWDLAASLRAAQDALPDQIRGTDGTGSVVVSLGRAGDVTGIDVDRDWSAHLDPTALGTAVVEAAGVAGLERMRALAQAPTDAPVRSQEPAPLRWAVPELADGMVVPPLEDVAEQAISALHNAASAVGAVPSVPADVVGTGADGRVTVGFAAGSLTRCEIDRGWADGRAGPQVTMALNEALGAARAALRAEAEAVAQRSAEIDTLLAAALAHLRPPDPAVTGTPHQGDHHV